MLIAVAAYQQVRRLLAHAFASPGHKRFARPVEQALVMPTGTATCATGEDQAVDIFECLATPQRFCPLLQFLPAPGCGIIIL